jgi:hypothetical protein
LPVQFCTLPLAVKTVTGALKNYDDMEKLMPSLGVNIQVILLTTLLTGGGILLGLLLPLMAFYLIMNLQEEDSNL